jgi:hypothetical protein
MPPSQSKSLKPSELDWEAHKETIRQLFLVERASLPKLKTSLADQGLIVT